jgi:hypothetical protein
MCIGSGTSTFPPASCANASSTAATSRASGATLALMVS